MSGPSFVFQVGVVAQATKKQQQKNTFHSPSNGSALSDECYLTSGMIAWRRVWERRGERPDGRSICMRLPFDTPRTLSLSLSHSLAVLSFLPKQTKQTKPFRASSRCHTFLHISTTPSFCPRGHCFPTQLGSSVLFRSHKEFLRPPPPLPLSSVAKSPPPLSLSPRFKKLLFYLSTSSFFSLSRFSTGCL